MSTDRGTEAKEDEPAPRVGEGRGISVGRDASGNAFVSGDNNQVIVIIYQRVEQRRDVGNPPKKDFGLNPYMGLLAFHEEDADRFFGRETQVTRLWEKLRDLQQATPVGRVALTCTGCADSIDKSSGLGRVRRARTIAWNCLLDITR